MFMYVLFMFYTCIFFVCMFYVSFIYGLYIVELTEKRKVCGGHWGEFVGVVCVGKISSVFRIKYSAISGG